jgi:hypothetical protein
MEYAYTPKEKAKELFEKMYTCYQGHIDAYTAKQCALIAIDETIIALEENQWQNRNQIAYYKEVKQEIQKP